MYVTTNRIKVRKGYGPQLEQLFQHQGGVAREPGFLGFERWKSDRSPEHEEYLVVTHWESQEAHNQWVESDSFKRAHSGPPSDFILGPGELGSYDVRLSTQAEV